MKDRKAVIREAVALLKEQLEAVEPTPRDDDETRSSLHEEAKTIKTLILLLRRGTINKRIVDYFEEESEHLVEQNLAAAVHNYSHPLASHPLIKHIEQILQDESVRWCEAAILLRSLLAPEAPQ